ncbi:uncharacterized protein LOC133771404 [Lepus europaeus]|uniref:uncharacterized protein LOC133771404 n=1 Tax=Lepus europaeus TaxID=9983 RepID=UPI002B47D2C2|nr:uncharacterized protein LOC133771404 [Lepus europaeus]XP_062063160.1 uncharacterized protein LOC133771404 [Lepus europaeus]XP_062063162.1 uncharacterized protein LOC133771404 [Lepus europaeus]XP_062063163.1 uncharacterized protein LOC133771404 [Lepus europaeus]XP_062063164.1 uncharacterized protein LOC133771404 [Lepus europaeus]XP_062063165.1 uncharacterized protein LOC133771404 [Lepus europaeus]XP_062063166.1 uncharacterized protein LOC133771404 [Lepus europaeus]XP_062063167.1 uncharacte
MCHPHAQWWSAVWGPGMCHPHAQWWSAVWGQACAVPVVSSAGPSVCRPRGQQCGAGRVPSPCPVVGSGVGPGVCHPHAQWWAAVWGQACAVPMPSGGQRCRAGRVPSPWSAVRGRACAVPVVSSVGPGVCRPHAQVWALALAACEMLPTALSTHAWGCCVSWHLNVLFYKGRERELPSTASPHSVRLKPGAGDRQGCVCREPTSHTRARVRVPAAPLLIQLPANALGKQWTVAQAPAPTRETQRKLLAPGVGLAQPPPPWAWRAHSRWDLSLPEDLVEDVKLRFIPAAGALSSVRPRGAGGVLQMQSA